MLCIRANNAYYAITLDDFTVTTDFAVWVIGEMGDGVFQADAPGNDTAQIMLGHQAKLNVDIGQTKVAVKQKRVMPFEHHCMGERNGKPVFVWVRITRRVDLLS